jgi:NADPH2:quinone reductase
MRAWRSVAKGIGGLEMTVMPRPDPGPGEILVEVEAAALNFFDVLMLEDRYQVKPTRPFVMGQEFAGTIAAVGEGVSMKVGDTVATITAGQGAFAEYAVATADGALAIPPSMSVRDGATLPIVYMTAALALTESTVVQPGETVLVLAAAGGVGLASVEVAAALGATVVAAAGGAAKCEVARQHGAAHAVDYDRDGWADEAKQLTGGRGFDVVVDNVGGDRTLKALRILATDGRLLVIGFASGEIPNIPANRLLLKRASAIGVYLGGERGGERPRRVAARLAGLAAAGAIRPHAGAIYPFEELPAALEALGSRKTTGKVLLAVRPGRACLTRRCGGIRVAALSLHEHSRSLPHPDRPGRDSLQARAFASGV